MAWTMPVAAVREITGLRRPRTLTPFLRRPAGVCGQWNVVRCQDDAELLRLTWNHVGRARTPVRAISRLHAGHDRVRPRAGRVHGGPGRYRLVRPSPSPHADRGGHRGPDDRPSARARAGDPPGPRRGRAARRAVPGDGGPADRESMARLHARRRAPALKPRPAVVI